MTEIKYETDGGFCLTPCPFEITDSAPDSIYRMKVGSHGCCNCPNFLARDLEKKIITCKIDEK